MPIDSPIMNWVDSLKSWLTFYRSLKRSDTNKFPCHKREKTVLHQRRKISDRLPPQPTSTMKIPTVHFPQQLKHLMFTYVPVTGISVRVNMSINKTASLWRHGMLLVRFGIRKFLSAPREPEMKGNLWTKFYVKYPPRLTPGQKAELRRVLGGTASVILQLVPYTFSML